PNILPTTFCHGCYTSSYLRHPEIFAIRLYGAAGLDYIS
ncbi:MAG: hypothetical protein ACI9LM_004610, partial [Alteromonadaceae bacterium]